MSSSISSSDAAPAWGRWLAVFAGTLAAAAAALMAFLLAVDPYDTGRFGLFGIEGIDDREPSIGNVSRARDQRFNAAIIGNSSGQLLSPSELSRLTGSRFVQLSVPFAGPREELITMSFFVSHHRAIDALVITMDPSWCTRDPALPLRRPFPRWLYEGGRLEYAARLFSLRALGRAWRRVRIGLGLRQPIRPDGYWNYTLFPIVFQPEAEPMRDTTPDFAGNASEDFPGIARLEAAIGELPADVAVVLFAPPMFYTTLPRPGSRAAAEDAACKRALQRLAARRARVEFIDYRRDDATARDASSFYDAVHMGERLAREIEDEIAQSIRRSRAGAGSSSQSMIPKKPAPHSMRDLQRLSEKIMLHQ